MTLGYYFLYYICIVLFKIVHYLLYEKNNGGCDNVINPKRNRRF